MIRLATVLVVDDSEFMRRVLKNILESGEHKVREAKNANEALDLFKRRPELASGASTTA